MTDWRLDLAQLSDPAEEGISTEIVREDLLKTDGDQGQRLWFSYTLNGPGAIEFTLPIDKPTREDYAVGRRELHLYRDDELIWGGYLLRAEIDDTFVRFGGLGWLWRLRRRLITTDLGFKDVDPCEIAWQLIDFAQSQTGGNFGVTLQPEPLPNQPGRVKSIAYCGFERTVIADAIDDLAEMRDGFDYEITPDKVFRVWEERGTSLAVEIDAGRQTTSLAGIVEDASEVTSELSVIGPRENCSNDNGLTLSNPQAVAAYGLLQDEVQYDNRDVRIRRDKGRAELDALRRINLQPKVELRPGVPGTPEWGQVSVGDEIGFLASNGYATYDMRARVIGQEFEILPAEIERWAWQLDGDL